jgi:hypothetical protein
MQPCRSSVELGHRLTHGSGGVARERPLPSRPKRTALMPHSGLTNSGNGPDTIPKWRPQAAWRAAASRLMHASYRLIAVDVFPALGGHRTISLARPCLLGLQSTSRHHDQTAGTLLESCDPIQSPALHKPGSEVRPAVPLEPFSRLWKAAPVVFRICQGISRAVWCVFPSRPSISMQ